MGKLERDSLFSTAITTPDMEYGTCGYCDAALPDSNSHQGNASASVAMKSPNQRRTERPMQFGRIALTRRIHRPTQIAASPSSQGRVHNLVEADGKASQASKTISESSEPTALGEVSTHRSAQPKA